MAPTLIGFKGLKSCIKNLAGHPHKIIFNTYNYYDGSNFIRLTCSGNQVKDYTTHNFLEFHQDAYHARILNIRRLVSCIFYTLLDVDVFWRVHIQPDVASNSTDG